MVAVTPELLVAPKHPVNLTHISLGLAILAVLYLSGQIIYNVYFHPLAKYPGPKLYSATYVPYVVDGVRGNFVARLHRFHERYGPVVRFKPNGLSYITEQGWKDIYGTRHGKKQLPKDPQFYARQHSIPDIIISTDADHSRIRRLLSHAFSEHALREQEPLVIQYFDRLIQKLHEQVQGPTQGKINVVRWYNYTTFDVIGDLAFGEPFGGLENEGFHFWIDTFMDSFRFLGILRAIILYPPLKVLLPLMIKFFPKLPNAREKHTEYTKATLGKRLNSSTPHPERKDFVDYILRYNDEKGMSVPEIEKTSEVLILAGSETTATLLSGATFHLLQNPHVIQKLTEIIRSTFKTEDEITFQSTARIPFLHAVLEETFRVYPPVPEVLPRKTPPEGDIIAGQFVPGDTAIGVSQYSAYHSPLNFHLPNSFLPERWLPSSDPRFVNDNRGVLQPFSFGPRNCIGKNLAYAEMRCVLARMVWNFDMQLCEESREWSQQRVFTLWEKRDLWVVLKERKE
ncbi:MAG: hypothetical protein MMC33_004151 [Icmadophila ericetorum]|nr:hypothetical protein [Icmadophila ericetorum]